MEFRIAALKRLLEFFAQPQNEQMRETPDLMDPVQVRIDDFEFVTRMSRRILAALLVSLLREFRLALPSRGEVLEEIQVG